MIHENENPDTTSLAAEIESGSDQIAMLSHRLERYSKAKHKARAILQYARLQKGRGLGRGSVKRMAWCGEWLRFHHYYTVNKVLLSRAPFCKKHLLCPLCAIRRASKQVGAYVERLNHVKAENEALRASLVTITVRNGPDLAERFEHLRRGVQILRQRKKNSKKGLAHASEWCKVLGLVGTYEVTNKDKGWHPHAHIFVLHRDEIVQDKLRSEWKKITGDSWQVDVTPCHHPDDPGKDFVEVFKYSVKFTEMSIPKVFEAFNVLTKKRMIYNGGLLYNVKVPEKLTDDLPLDDLPYFEMFYKFVPGSGYNYKK